MSTPKWKAELKNIRAAFGGVCGCLDQALVGERAYLDADLLESIQRAKDRLCVLMKRLCLETDKDRDWHNLRRCLELRAKENLAKLRANRP